MLDITRIFVVVISVCACVGVQRWDGFLWGGGGDGNKCGAELLCPVSEFTDPTMAPGL